MKIVNIKAGRIAIIKILSGIILAVVLIYSSAFSDQGVSIIHMNKGAQSLSFVELEQMKQHSSKVKAIDPNFPSQKEQTFEGIDMKILIESIRADIASGVTIVGTDQYVGYLPFSQVEKHNVFLAWLMDENPISPLKGGPLKIVCPKGDGIDPNCYTWYVEAIFLDSIESPELLIENQGIIERISQKKLDDMSTPIDRSLVSKPAGCRYFYPSGPEHFKAVTLKKLLSAQLAEGVDFIEFIPWVGAGVTVDKGVMDKNVLIVCSMSGNAIHPVFGGPFSVMFPLETDAELVGQVPESGALFFLQKIIIK